MEIRSDTFLIQHHERDLNGDLVEPEQQPAVRLLEVDGPTHLGQNPTGQELPTTVALEDNAGQFAKGLRSQCFLCKHFKPELAAQVIETWKGGTIQQRAALNEIRAALMQTQNATVQARMENPLDPSDIDVEQGLSHLGLCEIFSEITNDVMFVHATGACPEGQDYFVAKDVASEKYGASKFDEIMRRAQGKA